MKRILASLMLASAGFLATAQGLSAAEEKAVFAGGCFWCVESDMDHVRGVLATTSGYAGGTKPNPTYEDHEGYTEAVEVVFDSAVISYEQLAAHFLRTIDVTDGRGQFCDRGRSYIPALVPLDKEQGKTAKKILAAAEAALGTSLDVEIFDNPSFVKAEDYHQDYYKGSNRVFSRFGLIRQSKAYELYREGCGRNERVKQVWGKDAYSFPDGGMGNGS